MVISYRTLATSINKVINIADWSEHGHMTKFDKMVEHTGQFFAENKLGLQRSFDVNRFYLQTLEKARIQFWKVLA